jgi:HEPN domain-containing protein
MMSSATRMKALINDFAVRSFRDTADGDYIAARSAFRCTLYQQCFWSSQQAVEKYLKCILLLNRIPATNMGHNLCFGLDKIGREGKFQVRLSPECRQFIEHLSTYGNHRYFETSYYSLGSEIFILDRTVWELRRYCTVLDYCLEEPNGEKKEMLELRRIEQSENESPKKLQLQRGYLEKVIRDKEHLARKALI